MANRRPRKTPQQSRGLSIERARSGQGWVLVHPLSVRECADDLEEVRTMIAAGESEVAIDELRWLIEVCNVSIEAHFLLGKLAVEDSGDLPLARAHFGIGYQLGARAFGRAGKPTPLLALHPANRSFFDAGRGLAWCLTELGKRDMALEVVENLLYCDPSDPLGLRDWIDEIKTAGATVVELDGLFLPPKKRE